MLHSFRKIILIIFFLQLVYSSSFCQNKHDDVTLLKNKNYSVITADNNYRENLHINNTKTLQLRHKGIFAKYNPFSLSAKLTMLVYQKLISPQMFRYCFYERSCSNFSKKAIEEVGLIKGIFLSADRILRCNTIAIEDITTFDEAGFAIDEPSFYRKK